MQLASGDTEEAECRELHCGRCLCEAKTLRC
jgi:hypothetical protein